MKPALKPLRQQVIVITGASGGIGRVTARVAAGRGARVVAAARTRPVTDCTNAAATRVGSAPAASTYRPRNARCLLTSPPPA